MPKPAERKPQGKRPFRLDVIHFIMVVFAGDLERNRPKLEAGAREPSTREALGADDLAS